MMATFILAFGAIFTPTIAEAKKTVWEDGDSNFKIGFRYQARFRYLSEAEEIDGVYEGRDYDFDFRRLRIATSGKLNNFVSFSAQTDIGDKIGTPLLWRDALVTFKFSNAARVSFGLFKVQFTRSTNGSGYGQLALDRPLPVGKSTNSSKIDGSIGGKRDQQVVLWGNLGKFQYRLGVGDGAATVDSEPDSLRMAARVHFALFDAEKGLGYKETYLGKKDILTIGAGYDTQAAVHTSGETGDVTDNTAYTVDVHFEKVLGGGNVINVNGAYYARDLGDDTSSSQGIGYHVTAGFLLGGKIMPYVRYAIWDVDLEDKDESHINVGLNYLIKKHKSKIVFDYDMVTYEKEGDTLAKKDHGVFTIQVQLDF